ncbi:uracil-DNA glycosylase family protein [Chitinimonas taiwanensis]|uniref:uracil-DNA glycosylase family protein n=1 Tax=Chitinimonas taiwanensis TaxID=240412 RepID=UPI0035AE6068
MRAVEKIHEKHKSISNYPPDVVPVYGRIMGTSFFPGGDGLWKEGNKNEDLTIEGIMVVGHNFDNVTGFHKSLQKGKEPKTCPTWRNITNFLKEAEVDLENCFFTNVYVGLMQSDSNVGVFPGSKSEEFKKQCIDFLEYQISIQRPSIILTLGGFVPALISRLSSDLGDWINVQKIGMLDLIEKQMIEDAKFCNGTVTSTVIALTHPALRHLNVKHRKYGDVAGHDAEIAMLRHAMEC